MAKYNFTASDSTLFIEFDTESGTYLDNTRLYFAPSTSYNDTKITLYEAGINAQSFIFDNIGTIGGVAPDDIQQANEMINDLIDSLQSGGGGGGGVTMEEVEDKIEDYLANYDTSEQVDEKLDTVRQRLTILFGTDLHHNPTSNEPPRYRLDAVDKATTMIATGNERKVDLVLFDGDLVDETTDVATIKTVFDGADAEVYYVPGNHDFDDFDLAGFMTAVGMPTTGNYSFFKKGIKFIVVDANYNSFSNSDHYAFGNYNAAVAYLSPSQLTYLAAELANTTLKCVVLCHQKLSDSGTYGVVNASDARTIIEAAGNVIAVFSGHEHSYSKTEINGVTYYTMNDMVTDADPANAYSIITIELDDTIRIEGFGTQVSVNLVSASAGTTVLGKYLTTTAPLTGSAAVNTLMHTFNIAGGLSPTEVKGEVIGEFDKVGIAGGTTIRGYIGAVEIFRFITGGTAISGRFRKGFTFTGGTLRYPNPSGNTGATNEVNATSSPNGRELSTSFDPSTDWQLKMYGENVSAADSMTLNGMMVKVTG